MSAPFNFIYTPQPIAGIATNFNQVCAGECIEFSDNSSNSPTSWLWTFEGGNPATSNLQDPGVVCYQASGSFNVTLMVTNSEWE